MSYLIFKIISIVIILIIILFVVANNKQNQRDTNATNQKNNSSIGQELIEEDENSMLDSMSQKMIDYKAIHNEMYYVEYKLIPHFVDMLKNQPEKTSQIVLTIYENLVILQNKLRKVNPYFFGSISCEVCGDIENLCIVVYQFPKPFDTPLAKYGAIYINKSLKKYSYWTLEYSMNGKYFLGSKTIGGHVNYGHKNNLSKDEFIYEICQLIGVNEAIFQSRNVIQRNHVLELNDSNLESTIANYPLLAICFYDFNQQSQKVISMLEQLAQDYKSGISVGIYDVYDDSCNLDETFSIYALPTILFFVEGKMVDRHIGVCHIDCLKAKFEQILK